MPPKAKTVAPDEAFHAAFGVAVREARRARAWTQADLAERAELSPNYVARVERGELGPSLWVAHRVAQALGLSLDALIAPRPRVPPIARTKRATIAR